ncbi:hypothetical protein AGMMS50212_04310 [Spirochaetia bacterium]|nr:hypothetical protein AGMMS50212_04310 [Spirochaetia bacterium]
MKKIKRRVLIKAACVSGIAVLLFFLGVLIWTSVITKTKFFGGKQDDSPLSFYELLETFDTTKKETELGAFFEKEFFLNLLGKMEESTVGAEALLSVLKRYRSLALTDKTFLKNYQMTCTRAGEKFPHSSVIAALKAEAVVLSETGEKQKIDTDEIKKTAALLAYNKPLSESSFFPISFCLYVLADSMHDIKSAQKIPRSTELFASMINALAKEDTLQNENNIRENLIVDQALLQILSQKQEQAAIPLENLNVRSKMTPNTIEFLAEYFYDFSNPLIAAELWMRLAGDKNIFRAASAYYLAGQLENARKLWSLLAIHAIHDEGNDEYLTLRANSLYNLASTMNDSKNNEKQIEYLEQLLTELGDIETPAPPFTFGVIRWTRLQNDDKAISVLKENYWTKTIPLFDLELLRRRLNTLPVNKSIADTWLLLNRHPRDVELYAWAAWLFSFQRQEEELQAIKHFASQNLVDPSFLQIYDAIRLIFEKEPQQAFKILQDQEFLDTDWIFNANLALLLDYRHEYKAALESYKKAASLIQTNKTNAKSAVRLQLKIAHCYSVLGDTENARNAVLRGLEIDPDDTQARLSLRAFQK